MFYHVAKNKEDGRESRQSRSDGRQSRYDGDESARITPSTGRDGHGPDGDDLYDDDFYDDEPEPFIYVPKCMLGQPLKDFDSGQENTFVVVQNKFGKQSVYRFCTDKALFLLSTRNPIRRLAVYIATHQYFEILILLTIVTNCVFMALSDPPTVAEYVFAAIYTFEMIVKILSKGFILHKYSYLRNAWNWLDFLVVILGYITMSPKVDNLSGIRTFRVLRALKTISTVKGLKAMVNTLMKSMKMMTDVLILTTFFIAIFALIGLQMFLGKLRSRCVKISANVSAFDTLYNTNKDNWLYFDGSMEVICGNATTAWNCPSGYICIEGVGDNPHDGYISYDDFLAAMLTSLQVCTLDFWESVYNSVLAAMGEPYMIYFLLAVFLGPFYLLNLVLAVVSASYEQEVNGNPDPELEREKMESIKRSASTYSFDGKSYVEFLHGQSPVVEIDGEKRYTVDNSPAKKKKKEEKVNEDDVKPPELGENPSCGIRIRVFMYEVVGSSWFEGFITACILLNTVAMGAEHYGMSNETGEVLEFCNYIFTAIFFVEMVCKLIALTFRGYARNRWNLFDGILVMISLADLVLSKTQIVPGSTLSVLRVFRLMRVMKLAQSWKTMGDLISTIGSSIGALGNITVILGIIIYIFAVVGMQIFGSYYIGKVNSNGQPLRYNFRNFGNSFMMIFRILCGKWIEPQWQLMKLTSAASIIFIFSVFVIGRWVVLNLFLALLLSSFGGDALSSSSSGEDSGEKKRSRIQRLIEWTKKRRKKNKKVEKAEEANEVRVLASSESFGAPLATPEQDGISKNGKPFVPYQQKNGSLLLTETNGAGGIKNGNNLIGQNGHRGSISQNGVNGHGTGSKLNYLQNLKPPPLKQRESEKSLPLALNGDINDRRYSGSVDTELALQGHFDDNYSIDVLGVRENARGHSSSSVKIEIHREKTYVDDCFPICCYSCACCHTSYLESPPRRLWHNIRYYCKTLVENKYFEVLILFLIAFSSLTLVFEDVNLPNRPTMKAFLEYCNYFFAIIFTLEFIIKLIGFGFIKYFTNLWNLLDVFIVAISLATLFGNNNLNALRSLRALRPLRAISRFEGMKVVVNSLVHSIPSIVNVLLVCLVFWLIFSIMGYQLFGGQFSRCIHKDTSELVDHKIINTKEECLRHPQNFSWVKRNINFDNSINGFLALFQTASLEGWFEVMADAYDARGLDLQPGYMCNFANQLYFVIFIVLGAFFILNLFIGVIIDNFNRLKQQYEDGVGIFLTAGQRNWINTLKSAAMKKPARRLTRPTSKWRAALFDFIHTKYFEFFIMSVILVNMLTMMIQHYNQGKEVTLALKYLNFLFTGIFTIEAILRLIAMRLEYFKSGLNVFDFVIVVFSIAVIVLEEQNQNLLISPGLLRVVRVFRLGRLLRFFDGAKGIRQLLFTIVKSAPALLNIGTLLFLVMFIYAVMGMNLFSRVKKHGAITEVVNFETFGSSMCLLFRISTAAGWNGVLDAVMIEPPYCDKNFGNYPGGNCGDPIMSIIFFVSYITVIVLIMINMYIAVILENFNQAQSQDEAGITEDDLDAYYTVWEVFDPKATQFIKYHQLPDFIDALDGPLRVPKPNYWFLEENNIPIKDKHRLHCLDIMSALIKRAIGEVEGGESDDFKSVMVKVEDRFKASFPNRTKEATRQTTSERLKIENAAARKIQQVFRRHLLIHQMHQLTNTKGMSLRARERNMEQIEHLVTVLWKAKREEKKSDNEDSDYSDDDDNDHDVKDTGRNNQTSEV